MARSSSASRADLRARRARALLPRGADRRVRRRFRARVAPAGGSSSALRRRLAAAARASGRARTGTAMVRSTAKQIASNSARSRGSRCPAGPRHYGFSERPAPAQRRAARRCARSPGRARRSPEQPGWARALRYRRSRSAAASRGSAAAARLTAGDASSGAAGGEPGAGRAAVLERQRLAAWMGGVSFHHDSPRAGLDARGDGRAKRPVRPVAGSSFPIPGVVSRPAIVVWHRRLPARNRFRPSPTTSAPSAARLWQLGDCRPD